MRFTAKFGHLEYLPELKQGEIIKQGEKIGRIGNTGHSFGTHLHIDLINGIRGSVWRLSEIDPSKDHAKQSAYFVIDNQLFKTEPEITTYYCDPNYFDKNGKLILHPAYDVIPKNKDPEYFDIYWPRSMPGQVIKIGQDFDDIKKGYGYYCLIVFDI